jgi:hypothetical protein
MAPETALVQLTCGFLLRNPLVAYDSGLLARWAVIASYA